MSFARVPRSPYTMNVCVFPSCIGGTVKLNWSLRVPSPSPASGIEKVEIVGGFEQKVGQMEELDKNVGKVGGFEQKGQMEELSKNVGKVLGFKQKGQMEELDKNVVK